MLALQTVTIALTLSYFSYASPLSSGGGINLPPPSGHDRDSRGNIDDSTELANVRARTIRVVLHGARGLVHRCDTRARDPVGDSKLPPMHNDRSITVLIGVLCCNGIIKNCDQANSASIESAMNQLNDMPLDIQVRAGGANIVRNLQPVFFDQVAANQGDHANLINAEFDTIWIGFIGTAFKELLDSVCQGVRRSGKDLFERSEGVYTTCAFSHAFEYRINELRAHTPQNATKPPSSIDIDMFNNYLKGKNTTVPIIG
ncbi:hypothetical protein B0H13DRAFT_1855453 [Mycena leptocephala]|nr:hypothetical protein B0H13DRAFT_1855453 [Mycena leptocephala]